MKLKNKNVLITGAARGIGRAIALTFAKEGANIAIHCHNLDKDVASLKKNIEKMGRKVVVVQADLQKMSELEKAFVDTVKGLGRIDILVNNAGKYPENAFLDSTEEIWDSIIDTNLKSTFFLSQLAAKKMLAGKGGQIINISSVAGCYPRKSSLEYAISKAGIIHLTKCLALLFAPKIRVNCLAPSYTWTNFMSFMKDKKKVAEKMKLVPTGEFNSAEEVAEAALFMAVDSSKNITGQVLIMDGGRGFAI